MTYPHSSPRRRPKAYSIVGRISALRAEAFLLQLAEVAPLGLLAHDMRPKLTVRGIEMREYRYEIIEDDDDDAILDEVLDKLFEEPSIVRPGSVRLDAKGFVVDIELQTPFGMSPFPVKGDPQILLQRLAQLLSPYVRHRKEWIREVLEVALNEQIGLPWADKDPKCDESEEAQEESPVEGAEEIEIFDDSCDDDVFPDDDLLELEGMFTDPMFSSSADEVLAERKRRPEERVGHAARLLTAFARRILEVVWERESEQLSSKKHLEQLGKRLDKKYERCLSGLERALRPLLEEAVRPPPSQRSKAVRDSIIEEIAQLLRQEAGIPTLEADATAERIGILFRLEKGKLVIDDDVLADRVRKRRDRARGRRERAR